MEDYQERVIKERDELQEKETKLDVFCNSDKFNNLDITDQKLLLTQLNCMKSYLLVLDMRIARFNSK